MVDSKKVMFLASYTKNMSDLKQEGMEGYNKE